MKTVSYIFLLNFSSLAFQRYPPVSLPFSFLFPSFTEQIIFKVVKWVEQGRCPRGAEWGLQWPEPGRRDKERWGGQDCREMRWVRPGQGEAAVCGRGDGPVRGGSRGLSGTERKGWVSEPWSCEAGSMWRWERWQKWEMSYLRGDQSDKKICM